jgi:hypothetical protein
LGSLHTTASIIPLFSNPKVEKLYAKTYRFSFITRSFEGSSGIFSYANESIFGNLKKYQTCVGTN